MLDNPLTLSAQWARDIYFNELKAGYAEKARLVPVEETVTVTGGCLALAESLPLNTVVFIDIVK